MVAMKWLLVILGIGLFGSAGALVVYDVYVASQLRRLLKRKSEEEGGVGTTTILPARPFGPVRWQRAAQLAGRGSSRAGNGFDVPVAGAELHHA